MTESSPHLTPRERIGQIAHEVRTQIGRIDNAEVRKARKLARLTRRGALDVAYLGDSTAIWVAPEDQDRRPLHQMIRDELRVGSRMHAIYGGSYNPPLFSGVLRQIRAQDGRPVILVPLCVRMSTDPWVEHPIHGHQSAAAYLASLKPGVPLRQIRMGLPRPTPADWERFHRLPHPTWAGDLTVGDYVSQLRGMAERDENWVRLLYAYHHGGTIQEGPLSVVTRLGEQLRESGLPTVVYQTPVPVEKGSEYYGPQFRTLAEENLQRLNEAFLAGYGPIHILETGTIFQTREFIDYRDGSEHLNEHGRLRLAASISEEIVKKRR